MWAESHVQDDWFPWLLACIGFLDPFTMCGFLLTPLLTLALVASSARRAVLLCAAASGGCLAGNYAFTLSIGTFGVAAKLARSPQWSGAVDACRDKLEAHGTLAGLLNTLLPFPTIPLLIAAQVVGANVRGILLTMALGRSIRYTVLAVAILGGREGLARGLRSPRGRPA